MTRSTADSNWTGIVHGPRTKSMSKGERRVYWTATGVVCSVMIFSAINFNLANPFGPFRRPFVHLGLPDYLRIELTIAKMLGVLALLIPSVPPKIKEFAYFGFGIILISASIAHFSSGDGVLFVIDPLLFLGALIVSYWHFNKLDHEAHWVRP